MAEKESPVSTAAASTDVAVLIEELSLMKKKLTELESKYEQLHAAKDAGPKGAEDKAESKDEKKDEVRLFQTQLKISLIWSDRRWNPYKRGRHCFGGKGERYHAINNQGCHSTLTPCRRRARRNPLRESRSSTSSGAPTASLSRPKKRSRSRKSPRRMHSLSRRPSIRGLTLKATRISRRSMWLTPTSGIC